MLEALAALIISTTIAFPLLMVCITLYAQINPDFALWIVREAERLEEEARKRKEGE